MFPKGPRFVATKSSDIPGPNTYNPQDPDYDAYKRGAFLEKTNRFNKDKPSDVPGPGAYNTDTNPTVPKATNSTKSSSSDRYAVLQRKVEELERLHVEAKKAHHLELERLKSELSRAQKAAAEQTERADKLKKQNEALDARVQELKKASSSEQSEVRELRIKLRAAEHERTQLASKQSEGAEARKALQAAEERRREEVRDRDRKIAELEKSLGAEKKRRETVDARLQDLRGQADGKAQEARAAMVDLEKHLQATTAEAQEAKSALAAVEIQAQSREEDLFAQLEQHRCLLTRVAREYGRLASSTVPASSHARVKHGVTVLQLRVFRLERKFANAEEQVVEIANLVRHTKDDNAFLSAHLREAETAMDFYRQALREALQTRSDANVHRDLEENLAAIGQELRSSEITSEHALRSDIGAWANFYRLRSDVLLLHGSALVKGMEEAESRLQQHAKRLSDVESANKEVRATLASLQVEHTESQHVLSEKSALLEVAQAASTDLKKQLEATQTDMQATVSKVEQTLQKEKEANRRLAGAVQKAKQAEEVFKSEVEQLTVDLAEAERYQEAYISLTEEVDALIARNALAEEEAQRLSKFNAEIIGHNNPAQRIVYVDRIRRELHDAKQKLLMSSRDRDAVLADNDDLRHELELYKSVAVPQEIKPRTMITRVTRVPLAPQSTNAGECTDAGLLHLQTQIAPIAEMSLDEIM